MNRKKLLAAPQQALWDYLDTLLQEIPKDPPASEAQAEVQDWDPEALEPARPIRSVPAPAPARIVQAEAPPEPCEMPAAVATPAWARNDFQALLFSVGKLTLAVPLLTLHSVLDWPEDGVTPMPHQPGWCLGLFRYRERNVRIIDTGKLVIPPDRQTLRSDEPARHILIVGDGRWGLACDAIGSVVTLSEEGVRWRKADRSRPWLAGTVLEHLCALLDTDALAHMLDIKQTVSPADT
jgi:purine-binding chemotaxis protein CheW